mmetsp:Transcript_27104/g.83960  ORF Transcript_27104/g.83960 Transcript_27104/m.83960 type:complete len:204 (+) Transcript_27104:298-909(+)
MRWWPSTSARAYHFVVSVQVHLDRVLLSKPSDGRQISKSSTGVCFPGARSSWPSTSAHVCRCAASAHRRSLRAVRSEPSSCRRDFKSSDAMTIALLPSESWQGVPRFWRSTSARACRYASSAGTCSVHARRCKLLSGRRTSKRSTTACCPNAQGWLPSTSAYARLCVESVIRHSVGAKRLKPSCFHSTFKTSANKRFPSARGS